MTDNPIIWNNDRIGCMELRLSQLEKRVLKLESEHQQPSAKFRCRRCSQEASAMVDTEGFIVMPDRPLCARCLVESE